MTKPPKKKISKPLPDSPKEGPEPPDVVEQASEESFPASDAPSWEPLHPGKPGKHPDRERR